MQFLKKFFAKKNKHIDNDFSGEQNIDKSELETDELFVVNYKEKGGKFFYPESMEDLTEQLEIILKLTGQERYAVIERSYYHFLQKIKIPVTGDVKKSDILLGGCEYLMASEASILMTSKQLKNFRNSQLPKQRVIIATSDQIVFDKQKALQEINKKYDEYPSNIQSFSNFTKSNDDLLGNQWYETYLFLIEKEQ